MGEVAIGHLAAQGFSVFAFSSLVKHKFAFYSPAPPDNERPWKCCPSLKPGADLAATILLRPQFGPQEALCPKSGF